MSADTDADARGARPLFVDTGAFYAELTADDGPYGSKSEAMWSFIDADERVRELEQTVERLNRERRQLLEQRKENKELRRYVEDEQRYRQGGVIQRLKWWVRGMD